MIFHNFTKEQLEPIIQQVIVEANKLFHVDQLKIGMLISTTDLDNSTFVYKLFKINEDGTVDIALPDMVMQTVAVSTLYDPYVAENQFRNRI